MFLSIPCPDPEGIGLDLDWTMYGFGIKTGSKFQPDYTLSYAGIEIEPYHVLKVFSESNPRPSNAVLSHDNVIWP